MGNRQGFVGCNQGHWTSKLSPLSFTSLNYIEDRIYNSSMYVSCKNISGINNHFYNLVNLSWAKKLLKASRWEESFICSTYWALQMLDTVEKKINPIRSFSINSRGQPRQWEYQKGTGDNPLWLCYNHIFQSTYCLKKHGIMVGERGNEPIYLCRARKWHGQSLPTILMWVLFLPLFSNALLGFLTSLSTNLRFYLIQGGFWIV